MRLRAAIRAIMGVVSPFGSGHFEPDSLGAASVMRPLVAVPVSSPASSILRRVSSLPRV